MDGDGADIIFSSGTLQYLDYKLKDLLVSYAIKPRHIIINNIPATSTKSYWTVQNIGYAFTPYQIFSLDSLFDQLRSLGYEVVDQWSFPREIDVPFHPELCVSNYHGFYLRLQT